MADYSEFAEDGFDPIAWINAACSSRATDEPLDKFLAELEMRLQLTAEDLEANLHEQSTQAMRRIPFATQEIYRLQGDIQGMQDQVRMLTGSVQRDAQEAASSVAHIAQLDSVKNNMESACSTLKEATELSGLFVKVEEVFAAGDLPKAADILASMRRSLSLVGDVPEFRAGRQKLKALEDRLQTNIEGSLADAMAKGQDDDATRKLCGLLLAVDRFSIIRELYVHAKLAQVHTLWEQYAGTGEAAGSGAADSAAGWLATFLSKLLAMLEAEAGWGVRVLPGHAPQLLASLCTAVFAKVSKGAKERLAGARSIQPLTVLARELSSFGQALFGLLKDVEPSARYDVMAKVYAPLEEKVAAYGELEAAHISHDLRALLHEPPAGASEDTEALVGRIAGSIKDAFAVLHGAIDRCNVLTGGSEVRTMLKAVDQELCTYLARTQAAVAALSARHKAAAASTAASGADGEDVANVLQLIKVSRQLAGQVNRLEAAMRTAVASAVARLQSLAASVGAASGAGVSPFSPAGVHTASFSATSSAPGSAAAAAAAVAANIWDPVLLRLLRDRGERLTRLAKLGASLNEPRFLALPSSTTQLDAFASTVQSTVFDVLLSRVAMLLAPLPSMPDWRKDAPPAALPSFSAYPLPYVTAVGDYLMTMPQQLEVLMGDPAAAAAIAGGGNNGGADDAAVAAAGGASSSVEEDEELAAEWLDKVVSGAAALYSDAVFKVPELGAQGGMQLAADVEYFVNVMGALHVAPPPGLLTVQLLAGAEAEEFKDLARGALADGAADARALRTLAAMRRISLDA